MTEHPTLPFALYVSLPSAEAIAEALYLAEGGGLPWVTLSRSAYSGDRRMIAEFHARAEALRVRLAAPQAPEPAGLADAVRAYLAALDVLGRHDGEPTPDDEFDNFTGEETGKLHDAVEACRTALDAALSAQTRGAVPATGGPGSLSRLDAAPPRPARLAETAPETVVDGVLFRELLQAIIDWSDFAHATPTKFSILGLGLLRGPAFDAARAALDMHEAAKPKNSPLPKAGKADLRPGLIAAAAICDQLADGIDDFNTGTVGIDWKRAWARASKDIRTAAAEHEGASR